MLRESVCEEETLRVDGRSCSVSVKWFIQSDELLNAKIL